MRTRTFAGAARNTGAGKRILEVMESVQITDSGELRAQLARKRRKGGNIPVRAYRFHAIAVGFAPDEIDGAGAD